MPSKIEIAKVVQAAAESIDPTAEAKGVNFKTTLAPDAGVVSGDPDRLQQAIWNLLSNAVKFTPKGGHVELRLTSVNSKVEIAVSDDGQGISPDFLPSPARRAWHNTKKLSLQSTIAVGPLSFVISRGATKAEE